MKFYQEEKIDVKIRPLVHSVAKQTPLTLLFR
jgi:hypothetical protein